MGEPRLPDPVMLIVATFSPRDDAFQWAKTQLTHHFGPIRRESDLFPFTETRYYEREMGPNIKLQLLAFSELIAPDSLPDIKLRTNELEWSYTQQARGHADNKHATQGRLLNLDPGYLAGGKFILATTKDRSHRIYLRNGIYAEVTLYFQQGEYRPWPWTYPNYRRSDYREFLKAAREDYFRILAGKGK